MVCRIVAITGAGPDEVWERWTPRQAGCVIREFERDRAGFLAQMVVVFHTSDPEETRDQLAGIARDTVAPDFQAALATLAEWSGRPEDARKIRITAAIVKKYGRPNG